MNGTPANPNASHWWWVWVPLISAVVGGMIAAVANLLGTWGLNHHRRKLLKRATLKWLLDELRGNLQRLAEGSPTTSLLEDYAWIEVGRLGLRGEVSESVDRGLNEVYTQIGISNGEVQRLNHGYNLNQNSLNSTRRLSKEKIAALIPSLEKDLQRMGILVAEPNKSATSK